MVRAFIMIKTAAGKSTELEERVSALGSVLNAHVVAGQYDIIAEVEGEDVYTVMQTVATELHDLDGVVDTRTYVCLE